MAFIKLVLLQPSEVTSLGKWSPLCATNSEQICGENINQGLFIKKMPRCEQSIEFLNKALVTEETTSVLRAVFCRFMTYNPN